MSEAAGIKAGAAYVELSLLNNLAGGFAAAQQDVIRFGASIGGTFAGADAGIRSFGNLLTGVGASLFGIGAAALAPIGLAIGNLTQRGGDLVDMAARTGLSIEALSGLGYVAEQTGASMQDIEAGSRGAAKFMAALDGGSKEAQGALGKIGLTAEQLKGKSFDDQFKLLALGVAGIKDPATRAATAMQVLGKAGTQLLPAFADGAEGLAAMLKEAEEVGAVLSAEDAKAADDFGDALGKLWRTVGSIGDVVAGVLLPPLKAIVDFVQPVVVAFREWLKANAAIVQTFAAVAAGILAIGAGLLVIGPILSMGGLWALLGGGIGGFLASFDSVRQAAAGLWASIAPVFEGITALITKGDFSGAFNLAVLAMQAAWETGMVFLYGQWLDFSERWIGNIPELSAALQAVWDTIVSAFNFTVQTVTDAWNGLTTFLGSAWQSITGAINGSTYKLADAFYDTIGLIIDAMAKIDTAWSDTVTFMQNVWSNVIGFISSGLIRIAGLLGILKNTSGALAEVKKDTDRAVDARLQASQDRAKSNEQWRKSEQDALAGRRRIAEEESKGIYQASRDANDKALTRIQGELTTAIKSAVAQKAAPYVPGGPEVAAELGTMTGVGTFNAALANSLGGASGAEAKLEEANRQRAIEIALLSRIDINTTPDAEPGVVVAPKIN